MIPGLQHGVQLSLFHLLSSFNSSPLVEMHGRLGLDDTGMQELPTLSQKLQQLYDTQLTR